MDTSLAVQPLSQAVCNRQHVDFAGMQYKYYNKISNTQVHKYYKYITITSDKKRNKLDASAAALESACRHRLVDNAQQSV